MKVATPDSSWNAVYAVNGRFVEIVKTNHLLFITWATQDPTSVGGDNTIQVTLLNDSITTFNLRTNNGESTSYTEFVLPLACKSISIISEPV